MLSVACYPSYRTSGCAWLYNSSMLQFAVGFVITPSCPGDQNQGHWNQKWAVVVLGYTIGLLSRQSFCSLFSPWQTQPQNLLYSHKQSYQYARHLSVSMGYCPNPLSYLFTGIVSSEVPPLTSIHTSGGLSNSLIGGGIGLTLHHICVFSLNASIL